MKCLKSKFRIDVFLTFHILKCIKNKQRYALVIYRVVGSHFPNACSLGTKLRATNFLWTSGASQVFMSWIPSPHEHNQRLLVTSCTKRMRLHSSTTGVSVPITRGPLGFYRWLHFLLKSASASAGPDENKLFIQISTDGTHMISRKTAVWSLQMQEMLMMTNTTHQIEATLAALFIHHNRRPYILQM